MIRGICKCTQDSELSPICLGDNGVSDLLADHLAPVGLGETRPADLLFYGNTEYPIKGKSSVQWDLEDFRLCSSKNSWWF